MKYEVRFQVAGEDHSQAVEAESAATAASLVQEQFLNSNDAFELIQVTLLEDNIAHEFPANSDAIVR